MSKSHTYTPDQISAAQEYAAWLKASETDVSALVLAMDAAVPGGSGVRAYATAAGVSPSTVTRGAAAGALLAAFDTLPGRKPASVTGPWASNVARENDRGGIGSRGIRKAIREADTCEALWTAIGGAVAQGKADAAEKRAARPADDPTGEGAEGGTPDTGNPVADALSVARDLSRRLAAIRKAGTFGPDDAATLASIRKASDHVARDVDAILGKISDGDATPAVLAGVTA